MEAINIKEKYKAFKDKWSPHVIAELNGQQVLLAKVEGDFVWHAHENEDELFHVIKGKLTIEFRDKTVELLPGELLVVPKGVEHKPSAEEETWIMLFEPLGIKHTGEIKTDITKSHYPRI
mgnify:CR=1 FL=1